MSFRYFNLRKAQIGIFSKPPQKHQFNRRKFIKTAGMSALAVTPIISSADKIESVFNEPFRILPLKDGFVVQRKNKTCWKYPSSQFEKGAKVTINKFENKHELIIENLKLKSTKQSFDLRATIYQGLFSWKIKFEIPQFGIARELNFSDWLDNKEVLDSEAVLNLGFGGTDFNNNLWINGKVNFKMDNRWNIYLEGKDAVTLNYLGKSFRTSSLSLSSKKPDGQPFITVPSRSLHLILPEFESWGTFLSEHNFSGDYAIIDSDIHPDLNLVIWDDKTGNHHQTLWMNQSGNALTFGHKNNDNYSFKLNRMFFLSESNENQEPKVYFAAISSPNQWFSNGMGSFQIGGTQTYPELQAFGNGFNIRAYRFTPQLIAFKPLISHALTLTTQLQEPINIVAAQHSDLEYASPFLFDNLNAETASPSNQIGITNLKKKEQNNTSQQDTTKQKKTINLNIFNKSKITVKDKNETEKENEVLRDRQILQMETDNQNKEKPTKRIEINSLDILQNKDKKKEKVSVSVTVGKQKPDFAEVSIDKLLPIELKFKIVRPEDMLLLDFEFRNFVFNKKSGETIAELKNKKEPGLMIVRIQPQHTLEEAFFESNNLPAAGQTASQDKINIPVRYLRAYRSRLVFEYPSGSKPFSLNIKELMDWSKFELRAHPRAWVTEKKKEGAFLSPIVGVKLDSDNLIIDKRNPVKIDTKNLINYSLKLNQNNVKIADKAAAEKKTNINTVLDKAVINSFDISIVKKFGPLMQMGEIPEDNTCIEAPALMQMSPNQTAGFIHRIGLSQTHEENTDKKTDSVSREQSSKPLISNLSQIKRIDQTKLVASRVISSIAGSSTEVFEMWHSQLGVRLKDGSVTDGLPNLRTLRALWAYDANTEYKNRPKINTPFLASMDASDRHILVHTTSNYMIPSFTPIPIPIDRLMLTPLGAYLDWHVFFDVTKGVDDFLNIIEWQHLATLGRDHYVKIVKAGHLFPFGHRAALVKVTERKFKDIKERPAVNMQHMYVVVLQKEFFYNRNIPKGGFLEFPFQSVEIKNSVTPDIDKPNMIDKNSPSYNFYIHSGGTPFLFDLTMTDKEGISHNCKLPLAFVENDIARNKNSIQKVVDDYQKNSKYNYLNFQGEEIFFSESLIDGDTVCETRSMTFGGVTFNSPGVGEICFRPVMQNAQVKLNAVSQLTGNNDFAVIKLVDDNNIGHVFASVENGYLDFSGGSDKAGGFLTPNMAVTGLSRLHGVVGGNIEDAQKMLFNAESVFKSIENISSAKIFGAIDLFSLFDKKVNNLKGSMDDYIKKSKSIQQKINQFKDSLKMAEASALEAEKVVVNNIGLSQAQIDKEINKIKKDLEKEKTKIIKDLKSETDQLKKLLTDSIPRIPNLKTYQTNDSFNVEYKWQPDMGSKNKNIIPDLLTLNLKNDPKNSMLVYSRFEKPFDTTRVAKLSTEARFDNFSIEVKDCIRVNFKNLIFNSGTSGNNGVKVNLDKTPMEFIGALSFINNLNNFIPSGGFSDDGNGPYMEVTPSGVKTGYTMSLPNVELGICMLTNVSLGAYINLPFTGEALTIGFNFCTPENPFMLTISCFGGGGFVSMITRLDGLETIEAALEFGASLSLNLGVVSGGVSVMGGIYFKIKKAQKEITDGKNTRIISYNEVDLSAYIRMNGRLSVLGLIHASLEFYLELHAKIANDRVQKLEGSATLKIKVKIAFFSKTVSATVRRTLSGSGGDPTFAEMISEDDWQQYCLAFA